MSKRIQCIQSLVSKDNKLIYDLCCDHGQIAWPFHYFAEVIYVDIVPAIVKRLKDKAVYITIDLDVFDPSVFPGTGTPEPGGINFHQMLEIIGTLSKLQNVVGLDVVELSPKHDASGVSTAVACKTLRELVLATVKSPNN